ncbi:hypothetical protein BOX15_Mlig017162g3 [Macrostomum lignano]|uniref:Uncharacterized protein n=1 Tax=Macrostomum lignano TaxID=282301 RepID=A0A267GD17_9PLAT|nr:hypothetical protein BOX15_Mlig017162g3 [Macrostomum lignano]
MSRLMFNCAKRKTIYEHKFLVKAFQYSEGAIERRPQKASLIRRIDSDIIPNGWSITSILNMAACLLELRLPQKCMALVEQGKRLLNRLKDNSVDFVSYFTAYADYVEGVSHFEDTCPLKSGLDCSSKALNRDFLKEKYELSKSCLEKSASVLRSNYASDPLTASAVTMLSVVLVNSVGMFSEEALENFEKAVDLECALESGTVTATYLLQFLHVGANLRSDSTSSAKCKELYDRANSAIKRRFLEKSVRAQAADESSNVRSASNIQAAMVPKSNLESSVDSSDGSAWMTIIRTIKDSKDFLDGYRLESLAYLKKLVRKYEDIEDIPVRVFCILCITRHYLNTQALSSAKHQQEKAAHLLDIGFGIKLDFCRLARITYEDFELQFSKDHKMLVFLVALWLVNEGIIFILQASEEHQKKNASSFVKTDFRDSWSEQIGKMIVSYLLGACSVVTSFLASQKNSWLEAFESLNRVSEIVQKNKTSIQGLDWIAFVFLEEHLSNAYYQLDRMFSVDSIYEINYKLIHSVTLLLKDVDKHSEDVGRSIVTVDSTATDLMLCLHKAQVNFPGLLDLLEVLPYEFNKTEEKPADECNLDVVLTVAHYVGKLKILQQAYDLCQRAELVDTELYALIHMHVGIELFIQAFRDPTKSPYGTLSGAILKFRQAARILELLCPNDVKTAFCYLILAYMYRYHAQLDDQQTQCLLCLKKCLSVEKRLVVKGVSPSPWLWKGLEIVQFFQKFLNRVSNNYRDGASFSEDLESWNELSQKFKTALYKDRPLFYLQDFGSSPLGASNLLTEVLTDPLTEWEEKRNRSLKAIAVMMWDREFPEDSPPSDTEVRCYARYLMKLFDRHLVSCRMARHKQGSTGTAEQSKQETREDPCTLDNLSRNNLVKRNDFLRGMNIYSESTATVKISIIKQLQQVQNSLVTLCPKARKFHENYDVTY